MIKPKVTITTVAKEVGMSIAAVSRAFDKNSKLKPEKRKLILETADRLGYVPNKMASRLSADRVKIGVLIFGAMKEYYNEHVRGIKTAHRTFADFKVECDLTVLDSKEHTYDEAYEIIDRFIADGVDGVILSGFYNHSDIDRINQLAENNIPFILLDRDVSECKREGVVMNHTSVAGKLAAQLLSAAMPGQGDRVAVFCSDLASMAQQGLVNSFCAAAKQYNLKVVSVYPTYNIYENAYSHAKKLLEAEEIKGIYISSANSVAVCKCIKDLELEGQIGLVTSDVFDHLCEYINDGTVFATISQNPFAQASIAFEKMVYRILEKRPIEEFTHIHPLAVFASNLELYR